MFLEETVSIIEDLTDVELTSLLRRLLYAETLEAGSGLRGISVPVQITVADGGEDGRLQWEGAENVTEFVPAQFTIFQAKASALAPAAWKKEVWTKASQKTASKSLNQAARSVIENSGAYIGFTTAALIGRKYDNRVNAIKEGISEAGEDPKELHIDIYDANKIAVWMSHHPGVCAWLIEKKTRISLRGFQTEHTWKNKPSITSSEWILDDSKRFFYAPPGEQPGNKKIGFSYSETENLVIDHLFLPRTSVRVRGASGLGKSRSVYQMVTNENNKNSLGLSASAIFCEYPNVEHDIYSTIQGLIENKSPTLLVIDECPREQAIRIQESAYSAQSQLRIITIGNDDDPIIDPNCLNINLEPANESLISALISQNLPKDRAYPQSYIQRLCGGFPRIAILIKQNIRVDDIASTSLTDVIQKILEGAGVTNPNQLRALECASLFTTIGCDESVAEDLDYVASSLSRMTGDEMYEHLINSTRHGLVQKRGRYLTVQPEPIAIHLAERRIDLLRINTLISFLANAPERTVLSFCNRLEFLHSSSTAISLVRRLLAWNGPFGSSSTTLTSQHMQVLYALSGLTPELVAETIERLLKPFSIDDLMKIIEDERRHLVRTLERLAFPKTTFSIAAGALMRLAAAEVEDFSNNATGQFVQLYQLQLAGTEAGPMERFLILDEGLEMDDDRVTSVCLKAIGTVLSVSHFTRTSGSELFGLQKPLQDWRPKTYGEIFDYKRRGLRYLLKVREQNPNHADECDHILATSFRSLCIPNLFSDLEDTILTIFSLRPSWLELISEINSWLYFDRRKTDGALNSNVRQLYDHILPRDIIGRSILYTKFWQTDLHDPESSYDPQSGDNTHDYIFEKAKSVAREVGQDPSIQESVIRAMARENLNSPFPFFKELFSLTENTEYLFKIAIEEFETLSNRASINVLLQMLSAVDSAQPDAITQKCLDVAFHSEALRSDLLQLYSAVKLTPDRIHEIINHLQKGEINPSQCSFLSYGQRLNNLTPSELLPLLEELSEKHGTDGRWVTIDIINMYSFGSRELDFSLSSLAKNILVDPELFTRRSTSGGPHDSFQLETIVKKLQRNEHIDADFARNFCIQLLKPCGDAGLNLMPLQDDRIIGILEILASLHPRITWEVISNFYERASDQERHEFVELVGPSRFGFDVETRYGGSRLRHPLQAQMLDWAKIHPASRAPFLWTFFPVFTINSDSSLAWDREASELIEEFGTVREFLRALDERLEINSWFGSRAIALEAQISPLEDLCRSSVPEVSQWAMNKLRKLKSKIDSVAESEEESPW